MKLTKQEQDIVRRKFSKYCIEVLNGEALNYLEELDRLWEQEINFSDLGESILNGSACQRRSYQQCAVPFARKETQDNSYGIFSGYDGERNSRVHESCAEYRTLS